MPIGAGLIYSPTPALEKLIVQVQLDLRLLVRPRRAPQLFQRQPQPAHRHRRPEQHPAQKEKQDERKKEEENVVLFVPSLSWQTVVLCQLRGSSKKHTNTKHPRALKVCQDRLGTKTRPAPVAAPVRSQHVDHDALCSSNKNTTRNSLALSPIKPPPPPPPLPSPPWQQ